MEPLGKIIGHDMNFKFVKLKESVFLYTHTYTCVCVCVYTYISYQLQKG